MPANEKREAARAAVVPFPGRETVPLSRALPSARTLAIAFGVVAAVVLSYLAARSSPLFALQTIEVRGARPALAERIREALAPLEGESLLAFRSGEADRRLSAIPQVAAASYDRDFPHTLRVTVRAERSLAVLRQGTKAWVAAASGRVLRDLEHPERSSLPRVWLKPAVAVNVGQTLVDVPALRALRVLGSFRTTHFPARVRFVRVNEKGTTLVLRAGVELRLGDSGRLPLKFAVARRILRRVETPTTGPAYLDVAVPERPVASANPQVVG